MATKKTFSESTSAEKKSIGFEYQYYYFLYKVLNLKTGQTVGLELKDDVHSELGDDLNIFFQIKHTLQKDKLGKSIALTELDSDLWKTLYNWACVVSDANDGRENIPNQLAFIEKSEFHLVSNKSQSSKNQLFSIISGLREGTTTNKEAIDYLKTLKAKTLDKTIKGYISKVLGLSQKVTIALLKNVHFQLKVDDVIALVKTAIHEKAVDKSNIDSVFKFLDSNIRKDNFITVKNGNKISISFEDFMRRYRAIFQAGRQKLVYAHFDPQLPKNIFAQKFIQQLIAINDITVDDSEEAVNLTKLKLRIEKCLLDWVTVGDIVSSDVEEFHDEVMHRWKTQFRATFHNVTDDVEIIEAAWSLLQKIRLERFSLIGTELDTRMSNGELYLLSDAGKIGWHKNWQKL